MNSISLLPGDILTRSKEGGFTHFGLHLHDGLVLHNLPGLGEHIVNYNTFADNKPVAVTRTNVPAPIMFQRVNKRLRQRRAYDLLLNNCEHTVTSIVNGVAWSFQVIIVGVVVVMVIAALSKR